MVATHAFSSMPYGAARPYRAPDLSHRLGGDALSLGARPEREAAKSVIRRAVELGVTIIDTADVYGHDEQEIGHNERLLAEALATTDSRSQVIVATKGGMTRSGERWGLDGRPDHLRMACDRSLAALGVERLDLYQLHTPRPGRAVPRQRRCARRSSARGQGRGDRTVERDRWAAAPCPRARHGDLGAERLQSVVGLVVGKRQADRWLCAREGITFVSYSPLGGGGT